jgi:hypothetical protein
MEGTERINYRKGTENTEVGIKESTKAILQPNFRSLGTRARARRRARPVGLLRLHSVRSRDR